MPRYCRKCKQRKSNDKESLCSRCRGSTPSKSEESKNPFDESSSDSSVKVKKIKRTKRVESDYSSSDSEKDLININTDISDFTKCYICLNFSKEPIICRYCGNLACKKCLDKWKKNNDKCGVCRKIIPKDDVIPPIIMKKIGNYINEIDKIKEKEIRDVCVIHKEKILFFCMKCLKKYCGKCLFFGSEEAKKHEGHNIIDYNEMVKSDYFNIINEVNKYQEIQKKDNEIIEQNNTYKEEIDIIYNKGKFIFDEFRKMFDDKLKEKYNFFNKQSNDLKLAKENLDKKYKEIITNLTKLENINKKIENFDPKIAEKEINSNKNLISTIRQQTPKFEININFYLKNFVKIFTYQEIIKEKFVLINYPYPMSIKLIKEGDNELLEFEVGNRNKSPFILFLYINFNNKIYNFKKIEKENEDNKNINISNINNINKESEKEKSNLNNSDKIINKLEETEVKKENDKQKQKEEKEEKMQKIINIDNNNKKFKKEIVYVSFIPKNELNETNNNIFNFSYYEFSVK